MELMEVITSKENLNRAYKKVVRNKGAGVMENGLEKAIRTGVPQGGPLSVVLSNICLDKIDKELELRQLRFVRYADDALMFTKSEMAANRVMKSITDLLERKLYLKVNATKTKAVLSE